jgi:lipopolysaccharide export LptBFGC system permease protein LptF
MADGIAVSEIADQGASIFLGGMNIFIIIAIAVIVIFGGIIGLVLWYRRKKWNIILSCKIPRSDGKLIYTDVGKGFWDADNGWIMIKRKGYKPVPTRPIDPKKWLQGRNSATVIQVGPQDFIVALEDSYTVISDENQRQYALMDVIADVGKRKTWKNYTERQAKKTFTLRGWLEAHQMGVTLAIVIFSIFIGFAILWMRMPQICG